MALPSALAAGELSGMRTVMEARTGAVVWVCMALSAASCLCAAAQEPVFFYAPARKPEVPRALPEPLRAGISSVNEIYRRLNALDGKVILLDYTPWQPHPVSLERYADDMPGVPRALHVLFPARGVEERFNRETVEPFSAYFLVLATLVRDQYGNVMRGPVLVAVGTSLHRPLGGPAEYRW